MARSERTLDDITGEIVDAAYKVHTGLGPGLLESVYEVVLARVLERRGLRAARQEPVSFEYDGLHFRDCFRVDLLVEYRVVVEIKSVERLIPVHPRQLLTYLRLMRLPVGLLINFDAPTLKEGLKRIVNKLQPSASPREPFVGKFAVLSGADSPERLRRSWVAGPNPAMVKRSGRVGCRPSAPLT